MTTDETETMIVFQIDGIEHCLDLEAANDLLIASAGRGLLETAQAMAAQGFSYEQINAVLAELVPRLERWRNRVYSRWQSEIIRDGSTLQ